MQFLVPHIHTSNRLCAFAAFLGKEISKAFSTKWLIFFWRELFSSQYLHIQFEEQYMQMQLFTKQVTQTTGTNKQTTNIYTLLWYGSNVPLWYMWKINRFWTQLTDFQRLKLMLYPSQSKLWTQHTCNIAIVTSRVLYTCVCIKIC